jgi:ppGpp synthetase/RelA/SpoT-type nucleotidyltranferase
MSGAGTAALTDPEIDILVSQYAREMARYEEAARLVEDRVRRALRANVIRSLLSSRAKHPDDLRGKLEKKRSDSRYRLAALREDMNRVVTDLAGCRVMVYQLPDIDKVERVIRETFKLAVLENAFERHRKESGYLATHILVQIQDDEERLSLRGAVCEVQVTSIAAHVFNELEHDIGYKDHDCPPTEAEQGSLEEVRRMTWMLDRSVGRLLADRERAVDEQTRPLRSAEELQFTLEQGAGRPLHGEFVRLFRLLGAVIQPLTARALGPVSELLDRGKQRAVDLQFAGDDDVVNISLALFDDYADEFERFVAVQRGPITELKKAIQRAATERRGRR